jgi:integrase
MEIVLITQYAYRVSVVDSRSILLFESAIKTEATKKQYLYALNRFLIFAKIDHADVLITLKEPAIMVMLEDYLFYLKKRISPNSIPAIFAALELFLSMNDKTVNFKKLRKMYPGTIKKSGSQAWTTDDIKDMIEVSGSKRNKALILFMSSTGCRVGAIPELRMKHIKDYENCKQITFYPESKEEYVGFLTPESTKALDEYLTLRRKDGEKITDDSPVFRTVYQMGSANTRPMGEYAIEGIMRRILANRKSTITRQSKEGKRYDIQINHGFRKRYNTILKLISDVNANIAEKLLGHKNGLDGVYFVPTVEQLFIEFRKAIPELTIDGTARIQVRLDQSEKDKADLQVKSDRIDELERIVYRLANSREIANT